MKKGQLIMKEIKKKKKEETSSTISSLTYCKDLKLQLQFPLRS